MYVQATRFTIPQNTKKTAHKKMEVQKNVERKKE